MKKIESLYFDFEDTNLNQKFRINMEEIFQALNFLILSKQITPIPNYIYSEIKNKYNFSENKCNYNLEIIDTFDWESEKISQEQFLKEEANYEKWKKQNC